MPISDQTLRGEFKRFGLIRAFVRQRAEMSEKQEIAQWSGWVAALKIKFLN
ncbi:hypothetical protein [Methylocapsa aurea]|jgi:hypothetical protein|uniref:hypothetical protein n=1 Tax=Methylocapsa aurea TaxID=663610 RepID=UPI0012EBD121|nr:hypothetical protein [Methylocapsa aurea]